MIVRHVPRVVTIVDKDCVTGDEVNSKNDDAPGTLPSEPELSDWLL